MKNKIWILLAILAGSVLVSASDNVQAICAFDKDWPEKPCYDVLPGPSNEEKRQEWQRYYEFKGKEWMESKKSEMDDAIKDGTLEKWAEYQSEPENFANWNVWYYYYLNGQAPNLVNYVDFRDAPSEIIEPKPLPIYLTLIALGIVIPIVWIAKRKKRS